MADIPNRNSAVFPTLVPKSIGLINVYAMLPAYIEPSVAAARKKQIDDGRNFDFSDIQSFCVLKNGLNARLPMKCAKNAIGNACAANIRAGAMCIWKMSGSIM
ncbi:Uncharacterised protein [uncultured archaeon]|nr:Uncharacterised protein [uncultured archaeon]